MVSSMVWLDDMSTLDIVYNAEGSYGYRVELRADAYDVEVYFEDGLSSCVVNSVKPIWSSLWNVSLKLTVNVETNREDVIMSKSSTFKFCYKNQKMVENLWQKEELKEYFCDNGDIAFKFSLQVLESAGLPFSDTERFINRFKTSVDCTLLVEGKEVAVNKQFLSLYSPYFDTMFNGEFKETDQKEIEIKDVSYDEFVEMLQVLLGMQSIDEDNYEAVLEMSDRFHVTTIKTKCETFILEQLAAAQKGSVKLLMGRLDALLCAEKYNLARIQEYAISAIGSPSQLKDISKEKEFEEELSDKSRSFVLAQVLEKTVLDDDLEQQQQDDDDVDEDMYIDNYEPDSFDDDDDFE